MGNTQTKKELEYLQDLSTKAQGEASFKLPEAEVERLISGLQSSKPRLQEWSASTIAWLCKDNAANRTTMAEHGAIKLLVARLKSKDSKIQCWSVCAVGNLCIDNDANKTSVIELRGIHYIIKLLKSKDIKIQRWATNTIGILCMDNEQARDLFQKSGGIPLLVGQLQNATVNRIRKWSVFALGNLIDREETKKLMIEKNVFKPIVQLLEMSAMKKDDEAKRWAANVIGILCANSSEARVHAAKAGAIRPLIALLRDSRDHNVVRNAAFALGNVCLDNAVNKKKVKELGGLKMMTNMLLTTKNVDKKMENALAVAVINIMEVDEKLPLKLRSLLDGFKSGTIGDDVGSKLVDLVDESHTVAMRLTKRPPPLSTLFTASVESMDASKTETTTPVEQTKEKTKEATAAPAVEDKDKGKDKEQEGANNFETNDKDEEEDSADEEKELSFLERLQGDVEYDSLEIFDEIGKGSFGAVYKATYNDTTVAVKELFFSDNENVQKLIVREVQTLRTLSHPNILRYLGLCVHVTGTYLVTEFAPGGDLRSLLKNPQKDLPWPVRLSIATDIAAGMSYVHSKGIIHRDIKSKNVLLKDHYTAVLCDFGFARENSKNTTGPSDMTIHIGTNEWMAPEVVLGQEYAQPADVFSYGMFLIELLTREKPPIDRKHIFRDDFYQGYIKMKTKSDTNPLIAPLASLAHKCVGKSASARPTFIDIHAALQAMK